MNGPRDGTDAGPGWLTPLRRIVGDAAARDLVLFAPPPGHRRRAGVLGKRRANSRVKSAQTGRTCISG